MLTLAASAATAAGQRSFVSTAGVDNPSCSTAAPCRSFGAAVAATSPGGEVIALTSGGYGPVTITQSVSIIAAPGVYAGISVTTGSGVSIVVGPTDSVTLRGLTINNTGTATNGINFVGDGRLEVQDVNASGFAVEGLLFAPATSGDLVVLRSTFSRCGWGVVVRGTGSGKALLDQVTSHHNINTGLQVEDRGKVVIRNSSATYNGQGVWAVALGVGQSTEVSIEGSDLSNNGTGAAVGSLPGTASLSISRSDITRNSIGVMSGDHGSVVIAGTTITGNGTGLAYGGSGVAASQGNNLISGNVTDGTPPTVVGSK